MTDSNSYSPNLTSILEKVAIGALFLIVGWQYNAQQKMEDRIYNMQGQMFTEEKARALEDRLSKSFEALITSSSAQQNAKLDLILGLQNKPR